MLMNSLISNNLFDDFFSDFMSPMVPARPVYHRAPAPQNRFMRTDIRELEGAYELMMDLPGFAKEDVKAELKDGYLTVRAESKQESGEEKDGYIKKERFCGSCSRSFYVGEELTKEDIKARFENGVLVIDVPKKEPQAQVETPSYIAIE